MEKQTSSQGVSLLDRKDFKIFKKGVGERNVSRIMRTNEGVQGVKSELRFKPGQGEGGFEPITERSGAGGRAKESPIKDDAGKDQPIARWISMQDTKSTGSKGGTVIHFIGEFQAVSADSSAGIQSSLLMKTVKTRQKDPGGKKPRLPGETLSSCALP